MAKVRGHTSAFSILQPLPPRQSNQNRHQQVAPAIHGNFKIDCSVNVTGWLIRRVDVRPRSGQPRYLVYRLKYILIRMLIGGLRPTRYRGLLECVAPLIYGVRQIETTSRRLSWSQKPQTHHKYLLSKHLGWCGNEILADSFSCAGAYKCATSRRLS